jgi:hypothetical protein
VGSATVNDDDQYTMGNLPHTPSIVRGVQILADACRIGTATRALGLLTRVGSTTYTSGGEFACGTAYRFGRQIRETNPSGGSPDGWDAAAINAAQFGVRVVA